MAKSELKSHARLLRNQGESVKAIAQKLHVSKSTVSLWVRDIILSQSQLEILQNNKLKGAQLGRFNGSLIQKQRRIKLINEFQAEGMDYFNKFSKSDLFITGLALYWAEGSKKNREVKIVNSDPKMIVFMIKWLLICFPLTINDLAGSVNINITHKDREKSVLDYWFKLTNIPLGRFRKTNFIKSKAVKIYTNPNDYFGTFNIHVLKPARIYYKILGYISGLANARVAQW